MTWWVKGGQGCGDEMYWKLARGIMYSHQSLGLPGSLSWESLLKEVILCDSPTCDEQEGRCDVKLF